MLARLRSPVRSDRSKRFLLSLGPLLALLAAMPGLAVATPGPARDLAVGHGATAFDFEFTLSAHSGPSGEDPRGRMAWTALPFGRIDAQVTCFATDGNRAVVGTIAPFGEPSGDFFIWVEDNGPGRAVPDQATFFSGGDANSHTGCLFVLAEILSGLPLERGNVTVHDGQP